jgi:hypothetical protein
MKKKFLFILTILLSLFIPNNLDAKVFYLSSGGEKTAYIPIYFKLNNPMPKEVKKYYPEEEIDFQMDFWSSERGTSWQDVEVRISKEPVEESEEKDLFWTDWIDVGTRKYFQDYSSQNLSFTKSPGKIIMGNIGVYRIYFEIKSKVYWTVGKFFENTYLGYVEIEVVERQQNKQNNF